MKHQNGSVDAMFLVFGLIWLVAIGGWVANIVKFIGMLDGNITVMFIARAVGIAVAPLGSVLGFL